jgi:hypothetical protein
MGPTLNSDGSITVRIGGASKVTLAAATTTAVKGSSGYLGRIFNGSNSVTGVVSVYDALTATGNPIWSGTLAAGQVLDFGLPMLTGITVVTAGAQPITVSYS